MNFKMFGAKWFWCDNNSEINQYVYFYQNLKKANSSRFFISCDTNYALFINKKFVNCGQFLDIPKYKYFDTTDISKYLTLENNEIIILSYYQGENSFGYVAGKPALTYFFVSDGKVVTNNPKISKSTGYTHGEVPLITMMCGPSFEYNAKNDLFFDDNFLSDFKPATEIDFCEDLPENIENRPVKKLDISKFTELKIINQGYFLIKEEKTTPAKNISNSYILNKDYHKIFTKKGSSHILNEDCFGKDIYFIVDLGSEEVGYFSLDLLADDGTIIDIGYGEHLDDGKVRAYIGDRNFAFRYICKSGSNKFTHYFRRLAGRYIEVHVYNPKNILQINYIGLQKTTYPIPKFDYPVLKDKLHQKIYDICFHTLNICMHDHYEDTPWREQALYAMDSRNQALIGYYSFKNFNFAKASLTLLSHTLREDGFLEICAPSKGHLTIPSFSLMWMVECSEYVEFSDDIEFAKYYFEIALGMINKFKKLLINNLLASPIKDGIWNFYEWRRELADAENWGQKGCKEPLFEAGLNMFFALALNYLIKTSKLLNDNRTDELEISYLKIKTAINANFFNKKDNLYKTTLNFDLPYTELIQSLSICSGICENEMAVQENIKTLTTLVPVTLSSCMFKYDALMQNNSENIHFIIKEIERLWSPMAFSNSSSVWETEDGSNAFSGAGSLSHAWSAVPIYIFHKYGKYLFEN